MIEMKEFAKKGGAGLTVKPNRTRSILRDNSDWSIVNFEGDLQIPYN